MKTAIILTSVALALVIVGVLYASGPKNVCADRYQGDGRICRNTDRASAWERISGAVSGD